MCKCEHGACGFRNGGTACDCRCHVVSEKDKLRDRIAELEKKVEAYEPIAARVAILPCVECRKEYPQWSVLSTMTCPDCKRVKIEARLTEFRKAVEAAVLWFRGSGENTRADFLQKELLDKGDGESVLSKLRQQDKHIHTLACEFDALKAMCFSVDSTMGPLIEEQHKALALAFEHVSDKEIKKELQRVLNLHTKATTLLMPVAILVQRVIDAAKRCRDKWMDLASKPAIAWNDAEAMGVKTALEELAQVVRGEKTV